MLEELRKIVREAVADAIAKLQPDPPAEPVVRKRKVGRVLSLGGDESEHRPFDWAEQRRAEIQLQRAVDVINSRRW